MKISSIEAAAYSVPVLIRLAKKEDAGKWRLRTDQADMLGWKSLLELNMKDELLAMVVFNRGQENRVEYDIMQIFFYCFQ